MNRQRHYMKGRLKNQPGHFLAPPLFSVWELSPYEIARFGGELSKVMMDAARQYIFEKCYGQQKKSFENEAFPHKVQR